MGGSPTPPPAPDYTGAAKQQGEANLEAARLTGKLSNPNVYSPYGTQTVEFGQGDQPSIYQTFSPEQQALYEQDIATRQQVGKLGYQGARSLEGLVGSPITYDYASAMPTAYQEGAAIAPGATVPALDPSQLPERAALSETPSALDLGGLPAAPGAYTAPTDLPPMPSPSADIYNRTYQATLARPMEDLARQRDDLQSSLVARGLQGGKGYEREMSLQARAENDARTQAVLAANQAVQQQYGMDLSTRQQAQQEALANAGLSYQQGLGLRQQSVDEQMRRFEQMMAGTGRTYEQQQALRAQAGAEQAAQFGQRMGAGQQYFGQQLQAQQQQAAQAQLAFQQQADLRRAQIAEYLAQRQTPLNEISAALSQTQVQNPFSMPGYTGANVAAAPVYQAVADKGSYDPDLYNTQVQAKSSMMSGLMGLGGAAMGAGASYF